MSLGDEEESVRLTSIRKLPTGEGADVSRASQSSPVQHTEDGRAEKSLGVEVGSDQGSGEEGGGEEQKEEGGEDEEGGVRPKRGTQRAISQLERPESLEIDDQIAPAALSRNPRKSVLRKRDPTPVHSGPTYTATSPLGEPYDSSGHKRSSSGRECCSVM